MTQPAAPAATVPVYDPNGALVNISVADLPNAQAQGYVVADAPKEGVYETARAKGFGPVAATGLAAVSPFLSVEQGIVEGAGTGLASALQRKIAGVVGPLAAKAAGGPDMTSKEAEDFYKDIAQGGAHPGLFAAGEAAGMVGGAVAAPYLGAGGAAGALGKGLGAIGKAGEMAGAGAAALTKGLAGGGAIARAGAAGAGMAARGATELAIYDGVKELSEEMLGDPPLNAEKIFAAAADGAYGGAVFGGVLGAGGSLVKSGARGLGNIALDAASKNADSLQKFANEQRWKALDPLKKFSEQANARVEGGTSAAGEVLGRYKIVGAGLDDALKSGEETIGNRLSAAVDEVGQKLGAMTDASAGKVSLGSIDDAIESVIAPIRKKAGQEGIVRSLEAYKASLASKLVPDAALAGGEAAVRDTQITLQDALFQRKALDELVYKESKALDPQLRVGLLRDFRNKFENLIVNSFDDAARLAGNDGAKAELLQLKKDYQVLSLAKDASEASTSRMATNRNLSLTDYLSGGIASNIGTGIGQAVGGDYGAAIGGLAGGVVGARLNKLGRARGNAVAAAIADRIAAFGGKERVVVKLADAETALAREAAAAEGRAVEAEAMPTVVEHVAPAATAPAVEAPKLPLTTEPKFDYRNLKDEFGDIEYKTGKLRTKRATNALFPEGAPTAADFKKIWVPPEGFNIRLRGFEGTTGVDKFTNLRNTNMSRLHVRGDIIAPNGDKAGVFSNIFERQKDGSLVVHHDLIEVYPKYRGQGIGEAMTSGALPAYKQLGVDRIELHAGLSHGKYVWAKKGYNWSHPEEQVEIRNQFQKFLEESGHAPEEAAAFAEKATKTPKALAEAKIGDDEVGKDFLMAPGQQNEWHGYLPVEAAHAEMTAKAAEFARAQEAIKKVDAQVEKSAQGLVEPTKQPYREPAKQKPLRERYEEAREQVDKASANMQAVIRRASVPEGYLPNTSKALGEGVMRAAAFLTESAPEPMQRQATLGRPLPTRTSDRAMKDFVDRYDAANNPMETLRKFERGRITHAEVEALQVVSPALFKQLQERAMNVVVTRQAKGDPLPFQARQRLHVLLGILTDPSQDPKLTQMLQSNLNDPTQDQPPGGGGPMPAPSRPVNMKPQTNKLDQLEEG